MKHLLVLAISMALSCANLSAQLNMQFEGNLSYQNLHNSSISDIWGYTDEFGNEYAIVGVNTGGVSIVDVTDPQNLNEVFFSPGPNTTWRDMKTWGDYAYITNENTGGLKIIDMSGLPDNTNLPVTNYDIGGWSSAHNLFIDEFGFCYIAGANRGSGGVIFLDLNNDPLNPVEVGEYDQFYVHDVVVKDNLMYLSHISNGFFQILDVSDKSNPVVLGSQATTNTFTHNAWFSDDQNFLYTTDEVPNSFLEAYDISDPSDIVLIDKIQSSPGDNVIVHNTHYIDDYLVTSYYRDGVTIHDVSCPGIMVEVGNFDTSPNFNGNGFNGCWGVYPWLPSGNIIAADIEEGLYVLKPTYQRGCFVEGIVTDASTNAPIFDASAEIIGEDETDSSDLDGYYGMGIPISGTYTIQVSKPGYAPAIINNVDLMNGVKLNLDVSLEPLTAFSFSGITNNANTNQGLEGNQVLMVSDDFTFEGISDGNGNFSFPSVFPGTYSFYAGQWGYITACMEDVEINENNNTIVLELEPGIYDDFTFDFNWTSSATSPTGQWEIGEPFGTTGFGNNQVNPEFDVDGDCFDQCYVTGNSTAGQAGADDVDDGNVVLNSPVFDGTAFTNPQMSFWRWFANYDNTVADDQLILSIDNGSTEEILATYDANSDNSEWVLEEFSLSDFIEITSTMQLRVETSDNVDNGSLVEAGIDLFSVVEGTVGIDDIDNIQVEIYPNPSNGEVWISIPDNENLAIQIFDNQGKIVKHFTMQRSESVNLNLASGMYQIQFINESGVQASEKIIIE